MSILPCYPFVSLTWSYCARLQPGCSSVWSRRHHFLACFCASDHPPGCSFICSGFLYFTCPHHSCIISCVCRAIHCVGFLYTGLNVQMCVCCFWLGHAGSDWGSSVEQRGSREHQHCCMKQHFYFAPYSNVTAVVLDSQCFLIGLSSESLFHAGATMHDMST